MNNSQIFDKLLEGLEGVLERDEFRRKAEEVRNKASDRIIQDTKERKISWKRDLGRCLAWYDYFTAEVTVQNGRGEEIKLPAMIQYRAGEESSAEDVCLYLGNEDLDRLSPLASYKRNPAFKEVIKNILHLSLGEK